MDEKVSKGLESLTLFAVGLTLFRTEGRTLQVLLCQPDWLVEWGDWLLPETTLEPEEEIPECADRLAATLVDRRPSHSVQMGTYTRGKIALGAITICYSCVRPDASVSHIRGYRYRWCDVEHIPFSPVFRDLEDAVASAVLALSDDAKRVAMLISKPYFTIAELQRALNEVRRIAGRQGQMDIRNLRRSLDAADWLVETSDVRSEGAHRPSKLFAVREDS